MSDAPNATTWKLPPTLITRVDLARLVREVEAVDSELEAQKVRSQGQEAYRLPVMSRGLSDFTELNAIDLTNDQLRMATKEQLRALKDKAPVMHLTFAVEAEPEVLQTLVAWIRENAHPQGLLSVGLQPSLVGGVYVRTPNHIHDFSLRTILQTKRDVLVKALEAIR